MPGGLQGVLLLSLLSVHWFTELHIESFVNYLCTIFSHVYQETQCCWLNLLLILGHMSQYVYLELASALP